MRIRNINKVLTKNGNTADIITAVMSAYEIENDPQIKTIANDLKGSDISETCRNIWRFLIENIDYIPDSDTGKGEMIRTPARLLYDRTGDCKSYSLFTAVCLRFLDIDHLFRFVSYNKRKEATHVYVIAFDEYNNPICIDAVAFEQQKIDFNNEIPFTYRVDMANRGTKISYLAGLPDRVKINSSMTVDQVLERSHVWTGDDDEKEITAGKNYLYAKLDEMSELALIDNKYLREVVIYTMLIWAYNHVNGNSDNFTDFAVKICYLSGSGFFDNINQVDDIGEYLESVKILILSDKEIKGQFDSSLFNQIKSEVVDQNEFISVSGVHGIIADKIADYIKGSGLWYLYMFIPESELSKYPEVVSKKRKIQTRMFNILHVVDIFHKKATVLSLIRSGIIAQTGQTPENYIKSQTTVKVSGPITAATLATIATIISILIGLITLIQMIWPSKAGDLSKSDVQNGAFNPDEMYVKSSTSNNANSVTETVKRVASSPITWILLVAGAFLMKRNNN